METAYKEILLVKGLESLSDEELKKFVFFIPSKFCIAKGKLKNASKVEVAELMIQNKGVMSTLREAIKIFKTLGHNSTAQCIIEEKKKVDAKYKKLKMETKSVKGPSQNEKILDVSSDSRKNVPMQPAAPKVTSKQRATSKDSEKEPVAPKVTTKKPAASKVITKQPVAPKATEEQPAAPKVTTKKLVVSKVTSKQPAASKDTEEQLAAPKGTTKKKAASEDSKEQPAVSKATGEQPAAPKVTTNQPPASKVTTKQPPASKDTEVQPAASRVDPQSKKRKQKDPVQLAPGDNSGTREVSVPPKQKTTKCEEVNKCGNTSSQASKRGKNP